METLGEIHEETKAEAPSSIVVPELDLELNEEYIDKLLDGLLHEFDNMELPEAPKFTASQIIGTQEDILKDLKNSIDFRSDALDDLEVRIQNIEEIIDSYRILFLEDKPRYSKIKDNKFYIPDKFLSSALEEPLQSSEPTEAPVDNNMTSEEMIAHAKANEGQSHLSFSQKPKKKHGSNVNLKKNLENANYAGFDEHELNDLPGFIEAPQLLVSLSSKMGLKDSFLKYWTPFIRSEASCAILADSVWWFYLKYFKKDPSLETEAYRYFSRISDSFVALFMSADSSVRDRFFSIYAEFLPQAVYLVFYRAFPDSRLQFNDNFKQELCDNISEWILGIKPVPESYHQWRINPDIAIVTNSDTKMTSTNKIIQKISNLEKMLSHLGEHEGRHARFENEYSPRPTETKSTSDMSFMLNKRPKSHNIGEGSLIEKYGFNLKGQSLLISHYLKMHNLQEKAPEGYKMTRSQIVRNPPKTAPTYRDVIHETMQRTKSLGEELIKNRNQNEKEFKQWLARERRSKSTEDLMRSKRSHSAKSAKKKNKSEEPISEPVVEKPERRLEKAVSFSNELNTQFEEDEDKYNEVRRKPSQEAEQPQEAAPEGDESQNSSMEEAQPS